MTITEETTAKEDNRDAGPHAYFMWAWPAPWQGAPSLLWGGVSLTSPYRDVSALCLHHNGGHGHGDGDGIEVGGVWGEGEDGRLSGQGLPPLHGHAVEAANEPHGAHDGLEQEVHNPAKEGASQMRPSGGSQPRPSP